MILEGLEKDYYCIHNPIPVTIRVSSPNYPLHPLLVSFGLEREGIVNYPYSARVYNLERERDTNTFYIDISSWARQLMADFEETYTYSDTPNTYPHHYTSAIQIRFRAINEQQDILEETQLTRRFSHCVRQAFLPLQNTHHCLKAWRYYPFSAPFLGCEDRILMIPTGEVCNQIMGVCQPIDYDPFPCPGVYLKWLNPQGYYSYWLFPKQATIEREGDEIGRTPRSVFSSSTTSTNQDTFGFEGLQIITLRDKIYKPFWETLAALVTSPEVYILRMDWNPGVDLIAIPEDWIKVIQDKPAFERNLKYHTAEFEMSFEMPKPYTQRVL